MERETYEGVILFAYRTSYAVPAASSYYYVIIIRVDTLVMYRVPTALCTKVRVGLCCAKNGV